MKLNVELKTLGLLSYLGIWAPLTIWLRYLYPKLIPCKIMLATRIQVQG